MIGQESAEKVLNKKYEKLMKLIKIRLYQVIKLRAAPDLTKYTWKNKIAFFDNKKLKS